MPQRPPGRGSIAMLNRHRMRATGAAAFLLLLSACAGRNAHLPIQNYVPTTQALLPLGQLKLSNTQLHFASLEGEMKLQYVGIMPESAGPDIAGSTIYRVKNADAYFRKNQGKSAFCSETPLWVAVNSSTGAPAWSTEIWVGLLTLKDWATFRHAEDRVCAGGDYVRTKG
jgi:hypothetical protein